MLVSEKNVLHFCNVFLSRATMVLPLSTLVNMIRIIGINSFAVRKTETILMSVSDLRQIC